MQHSTVAHSKALSLLGAAALLTALAACALWLWQEQGNRTQTVLASASLGLTAAVGWTWRHRARTTRRWQAVLDTFAQREMGRARSRTLAVRRRTSTAASEPSAPPAI